jgi:hypothetical protein
MLRSSVVFPFAFANQELEHSFALQLSDRPCTFPFLSASPQSIAPLSDERVETGGSITECSAPFFDGIP